MEKGKKMLQHLTALHKEAIYFRKKELQKKSVKHVTDNDAILSFIANSPEFRQAKELQGKSK